MEQINVVPLERHHLKDISGLHFQMLPWSFNGQLGQTHIQNLYSALLNDAHVFGSVCYVNNQIMGFLTITNNSKVTRLEIQKVYINKFLKIFMTLILNPKALLTILESKFLVPSVFAKFNCQAEWLTFICNTEHNFLSPFVAAKLMQVMNTDLQNRGIKYYMAQGVRNNPPALKYYQALNWKIVKKLFMHNIYYFEVKGSP